MGYKGSAILDAGYGYFYAPYIPSQTEDYIFPRVPSSRGTEIETLPQGDPIIIDYDWKREKIEVQKQRIQECPSPTFGLTTTQKENLPFVESVGLG
jgi:hypothetical protein